MEPVSLGNTTCTQLWTTQHHTQGPHESIALFKDAMVCLRGKWKGQRISSGMQLCFELINEPATALTKNPITNGQRNKQTDRQMNQQRHHWTMTLMNWWFNPQENKQTSDIHGSPSAHQPTRQLAYRPANPLATHQPNSRQIDKWNNKGTNGQWHKCLTHTPNRCQQKHQQMNQ